MFVLYNSGDELSVGTFTYDLDINYTITWEAPSVDFTYTILLSNYLVIHNTYSSDLKEWLTPKYLLNFQTFYFFLG